MSISLDTLAQLYYVLCVTFVALFLVSFTIIKKERIKASKRGYSPIKPTHFLDKSAVDTRCDICFGELEERTVVVCDCGRTFHRDCVEMTKECPYCKTPYDEMKERNIKRGKCPYCGSRLEGNICPNCDTVVPWKDGTFRCECGHEMYITDHECSRCGAKFECGHQ